MFIPSIITLTTSVDHSICRPLSGRTDTDSHYKAPYRYQKGFDYAPRCSVDAPHAAGSLHTASHPTRSICPPNAERTGRVNERLVGRKSLRLCRPGATRRAARVEVSIPTETCRSRRNRSRIALSQPPRGCWLKRTPSDALDSEKRSSRRRSLILADSEIGPIQVAATKEREHPTADVGPAVQLHREPQLRELCRQ